MATKWRPSGTYTNGIYVIPDIHGAADCLKLILRNITPLRKSSGIKDELVFLGDYIDRGNNTKEVIDICIRLKDRYEERATFLMGNHELMMLEALGIGNPQLFIETSFNDWIVNGGINTIISYLDPSELNNNNFLFNIYNNPKSARHGINQEHIDDSRRYVLSIIPDRHIEFLINLQLSKKIENMVFTHAGYDPIGIISSNSLHDVLWDRNIFYFWKNYYARHPTMPKERSEQYVMEWMKTGIQSIAGHNHGSDIFISDQFVMLDAGSPERLVIYEARSRKAYMAKPGNERIIKVC